MYIIDTHCHAGVNWFEPVEMILHEMNLSGVQKAVLTQHRGNFDNRYLLESMKRYPGRFNAIITVDPADPSALPNLERLAQEDGVCGLRLLPGDRSPGDDPLAIWRKAGQVGLPISVFLVDVADCADDAFQNAVRSLPTCSIILEHLCGMYAPRSPQSITPPYDKYRKALELAHLSNTYVKFGGLGEFSQRPARLQTRFGFEEVPPLLEMAYEAFGPTRMMWGSDFPPVAGREGYRNSLYGVMEHSAFSSPDDVEWAFGKTAMELWKINAD